jgi:urease accessory protein
MPIVESLVAVSVIAAGLLLMSGARAQKPVWLPFAALAGLAHGYAFGESIIGAEQGVIGAYLAGLAIIAALMALGLAYLTRRFMSADIGITRARIAGGVVGCIGLVMLVASLVGA